MSTKVCTQCGEDKPLIDFWFNQAKGIPHPKCRVCQSLVRQNWKEANQDRVKAKNRAWQLQNPDRVKAAQERWKAKNPGLAAQRAAEWYREHKTEIRTQERDRYHDLKEQVYLRYGDACNCCGETVRQFLSIDHVNNDGNVRRKTLGYGVGKNGGGVRLYKQIIAEGFPDSYQILCMNCNWGKARNGGVCPQVEDHMRLRRLRGQSESS